MTLHEIPLERRTLHGHFARDLAPVVELEPGDSVGFATLDSGWGSAAGGASTRTRFEPRDPKLDNGHALVGPIAVRGARAGMTLSVRVDELRVGTYGYTDAGGWPAWLNTRLGVDSGGTHSLKWELDPAENTGRDQHGRTVDLHPFLGVIGMPPPEPGVHSTVMPRVWGGNLDCALLVAGTTLFLPVPVDGALLSAGDGHARQGDGEVSQLAIECPLARVRLTLDLRDDFLLKTPVIWTPEAWVVLGLGEDLDDAAVSSVESLLDLMEREYNLERLDALALASVVADLRVTQLVNETKGVHAVLRHNAWT
jgi:acetamidase/formamidase